MGTSYSHDVRFQNIIHINGVLFDNLTGMNYFGNHMADKTRG